MLVDTQPATHQHAPAAPEVRDAWVDAQLIGVLMDHMGPTVLAAAMMLPVMAVLMAGEVWMPGLVAWVVVLSAMLVYRYRLVGVYRLRHDSVEGPQRKAFIDKYLWTWPTVAALWGAPVSLCFLQAGFVTQSVCGLMILGQGLFTLNAYSAYAPAYRAYTHALTGAVLIGLVWGALAHLHEPGVVRSTVILGVLLLVFWGLLLITGSRLNMVHRSSFELQFSNQELIDSLTLQTRASLRAVSTKNRFLASAAHDLRQPVHALSLYADWLASEPEMARDIAPRILQSTRAINELFDSLFDLTRIDAGNYKVKLQQVNVTQLLADLVLQFEPVAAGKQLKLRTRAHDLVIWSDPVVLRRILGNLVSNALRHTQRGGVLVAQRLREGMIVFEVWDTGVGIAREHQQAIFQEFFRVSQHQGTEDSLGLGLTIVSKLAALMGYQLALQSEANRGSVFRVILPAFTQQGSGERPQPTLVQPPSAAG
ncbi:MAG: HAMP domain-containing histidine kinase [Hydrogenophaga sp.]|uniref:sensor histidine kinase n=1 Tax=Hydrogenophaga sp. TaxID=1904254 RepID=UPI001DAE9588|nr:HAMP domain-containing sensor histidine kinase [Hydrogenophaga sp.]MBX3608565.1 HAMP domain-containing histidine kinase [Hydrogenophaga sp.]